MRVPLDSEVIAIPCSRFPEIKLPSFISPILSPVLFTISIPDFPLGNGLGKTIAELFDQDQWYYLKYYLVDQIQSVYHSQSFLI